MPELCTRALLERWSPPCQCAALCGQEDEDGDSRLCWCALRSHPAIFSKVLPPFLALPAR